MSAIGTGYYCLAYKYKDSLNCIWICLQQMQVKGWSVVNKHEVKMSFPSWFTVCRSFRLN